MRPPLRGHSNPKVGRQLCGALVPFRKDEGFGKALALEIVLSIAEFAYHGCLAAHMHYDGRDIFAFDVAMHPVNLAIQTVSFSKKEPSDIENVGPHVPQDELLPIP